MWILLESDLTKQKDREIYFKGWSEYAPATTENIQEAHQFDSKEAAKLSAAYRFKGGSFVPVEVEITTVKSKAAA